MDMIFVQIIIGSIVAALALVTPMAFTMAVDTQHEHNWSNNSDAGWVIGLYVVAFVSSLMFEAELIIVALSLCSVDVRLSLGVVVATAVYAIFYQRMTLVDEYRAFSKSVSLLLNKGKVVSASTA